MFCEVIPPNRYSLRDLRYELSLDLERPLSPRTLSHWLAQFGIERDKEGFYHFSDLQTLRRWQEFREVNPSGTYENFRELLRSKNHAN